MPAQTISYAIGDRLYLNITDRCTLQCAFCPKHNGSHRVHDYDLTLDHRPDVAEIIAALGDPTAYREVVFCGFGEPTLRLNVLLETAGHIRQAGGRVRINTDGLANLVHRRNVLPELATCVDALSVSMNAQDEQVYAQHCLPALPGSFEAMLDFLTLAPRYIADVSATAIAGLEGVDIAACEAIATRLGVKFRRRELDVVG
ncbi:MAG: TatD family nuclease-associated radical SAM protein [Chromatiaceae bacterium]|jgi:TatD family-associated radical SAM protein|nr:TatD family nuclease-associated radical SAM protein [Chromatiaceae bacterium]